MDKLNKMFEAVVEKTVGRFLPEVNADASCTEETVFHGCCAGGAHASYTILCRNSNGHIVWQRYHCDGLCPV